MPLPPAGPTDDLTSLHVHRAVAGQAPSLQWVVQRFTPLVLAQARYRLGRSLRAWLEPADLVNDVWVRVLPHLGQLTPLGSRMTPALLQLLSTTLLRRVRDLYEKHIKGKPVANELAELPLEQSGAVTAAVRAERQDALLQAIDALSSQDQEIVVLRGIEQRSNQEAAALLGIDADAASTRYRRALARLRSALPDSVASELAE